ncbi:hypothetical protein THAOC_21394, partial [Thalassiosira oceanica]
EAPWPDTTTETTFLAKPDAIMEHCNRKYNSMNILCVEVNVEKLPSGGGDLDPSYEQVLLHQSLAGLIGIHGAQLTQGLLLPENSTLVELLPWVPINYFPSGHDGWGVWTQLSNEPTPVGIMFHNTDLHHYGFKLGRDSVPLCQNVSNIKMHKFEEEDDLPDNHEAVTELEHCLYTLHEQEFRWDERNFVVGKEMIDGLMTFYPAWLIAKFAMGTDDPNGSPDGIGRDTHYNELTCDNASGYKE